MTAVSIFKNFSNWLENKSLLTILNDIKQGVYKGKINNIRTLLQSSKKEEADIFKKQLPGFTASGTFNNGRLSKDITSYSKFIILDIDKLTHQQLSESIKTTRKAPYTYAAFISPSGIGLKILVKVNSKLEQHKEAFKQVANYYEQALNIEIDSSGSDVSRLCFMSYDSNCFINEEASVFDVEIIQPIKKVDTSTAYNTVNNFNNNFEAYINKIENTSTDITNSYANWRNIGFAIAEEFGENGRDYFHRISKFHSAYNSIKCDKQYTHCLQANGSGITIATFYHFAHQNNIDLSNKTTQNREEKPIENANICENQKLPTFPESLYSQLPNFLKCVVEPSETAQEKDMMLLGALTTISACLPKLYGIYGGDKVFSNLYLFITAPASAGKGKLKQCKNLVNPIHKEFREESKLLKRDYDAKMVVYNKDKGKNPNIEKPISPPIKMLFIPANNSTTGLFQLLSENDDKGLIFETEGDTLSQAFKTDYGNYSDGFRKAFHHETINYYRRTDKEYVEMETPCISTVLSGTPKQVITLMPNAENGLFSRFMFYYLDIDAAWVDVFAHSNSNGLEEHYKALGDEFYILYKLLKSNRPIKITVSEEQSALFFNYFSKTQSKYKHIQSDEYLATVRRLGLITYRIAMIFTALRIMEDGNISTEIECSDTDFNNAITMAKVLIKHSSKVFSTLPTDATEIKYKNKKERFLDELPYKFTRKDYLNAANNLTINHKTAENYITNFVKGGLIARESQNNYINPSKGEA